MHLNLEASSQQIKGFTGVCVPALGLVKIEIQIDSIQLDTEALVTDCDMNCIDFLIGQPIINGPGVVPRQLTLIPRIARWWLTIQDFDMEIEYRAGEKMRHVDALSQNPIEQLNVTMIEPLDWFLALQIQDQALSSIVKQLKSKTANKDIANNFVLREGRLYRKTLLGERLVVPKIGKWNLMRATTRLGIQD